ncbi:hypothetical protein M2158_002718 [Streptomyces sp. SAI-144]|uniref:hypothetical protein n=1 Tax=Streptomyces sp. SAI-144 TaxID=2940544 RepID=UPI002474CB36|nr:hypothetical protein [Streptomyces sp. SAI-144]MDH6434241.1 hypothetical protein [Streptomyces sp. SAI-144]
MSEEERDFEEQLRELLAEDAYTIRPSPVPYPQIRRQGVVERRRRVAVAGAVLATLAAVPVGAFAAGGGGTGTADTATTPTASASATPTATPTPTPSPTPSGPAGPATAGQLRDGITLEQAVEGLDKCLAYDRDRVAHGGGIDSPDLGKADEYRIILALNSTGDSNAPGDGVFVVAVKEKPKETRLICNIKDGEASGLNTSVGSDRQPDSPPVLADINANKLYQQSFLDKGHWKLPFGWGFIGTVEPTVAKVTVSYGGADSEAVLDHGWFVASGTLTQQVTRNPHIKGYDKGGKLIYDSDEDKSYQQVQ